MYSIIVWTESYLWEIEKTTNWSRAVITLREVKKIVSGARIVRNFTR